MQSPKERPWYADPWRLAAIALVIAAWLLLAADHSLHWDEPGYLYAAAYLDVETILAGSFQPSGIEMFSLSRSLHLLLMHGLFSLTGPGPLGIAVVQTVYLAMFALALAAMAGTLRQLLPDHRRDLPLAMGLTAFTPILLWLAFKTMPETPALLLATLACYALLRATLSNRPTVGWIVLASGAAALCVLFKNLLVLMPASMMISIFIGGGGIVSRRRLVLVAAGAGLLSIAMFFSLITVMGISIADYLAAGQFVIGEPSSFVVKAYFTTLEGGVLFASILLAFFAGNPRAFMLFLIWFALCTVPVILLLPDIEGRYLLQNILALAGLTTLAVTTVRRWVKGVPALAASLAVLAFLTVGVSGGLFQRIMAQDVATDDLDELVSALDDQFGHRNYTLVSPWEFSTFHYLRVAYPEHSVVSAHRPSSWKAPVWTVAQQRMFYGANLVQNISELETKVRPHVYAGFEKNLAVTNLLALIAWLPSEGLRAKASAVIAGKVDESQLRASWLWPKIQQREPDLDAGHYKAYVLPESLE